MSKVPYTLCPATGKRAFKTRAKARKRAKSFYKPTGRRRVYRCPFCADWHITSGPDTKAHLSPSYKGRKVK